MRVFIIVLVLIFSLQSWTKADDISDFQIEGMSIGDSLLDYFSKQKIMNPDQSYHYKESDKFYHIAFLLVGNYDRITFTLKKNDASYKIYQVGGDIIPLKIQDCRKKKKEIDEELIQMFGNDVERQDVGSHKFRGDNTGKSLFYTIRYFFNSGDAIILQCKDYSKEFDARDALLLDIAYKEILDWLNDEVYK